VRGAKQGAKRAPEGWLVKVVDSICEGGERSDDCKLLEHKGRLE